MPIAVQVGAATNHDEVVMRVMKLLQDRLVSVLCVLLDCSVK
jgi:hypothetical protein